MAIFGERVCGEPAPATPGETTYRCTLRNRHQGYHLVRSGNYVYDTWPRPEDVAEAKRRNGLAGT